MSLIVYKNGVLAGDSISMIAATHLRAPKVYPYRDANNCFGLFGWVGHPADAVCLMKAWLEGGDRAYKQEQERLHAIDEESSATLLIAPAHRDYLIIASSQEAPTRLPVQDIALGYSEGVVLAQMMFQDSSLNILTAPQVVSRVIAAQSHSNECFVREPVCWWLQEDLNHDMLDGYMADPISGQFIMPRPMEAQ